MNKRGIELDKLDKVLGELRKFGLFIVAEDYDAILSSATDGKMRITSMNCTIHFFEVKAAKDYGEGAIIDIEYPLGSSFVQYPSSKSPNELFKPTVWEVIGEEQGCVKWRRIK